MWQQALCFPLSLILTVTVSVGWKMRVSPVVTVSRGEDAVLTCSLTTGKMGYSGKITVKWMARQTNTPPFFQCSVKNDSLEEPNPCAASGLKYSLAGDPRHGELSLLIRKVELSDNGTFFCRVEAENNVRWMANYLEEKTDLYVTAQPQIASLSVVNTPCSSAPWRLQCEAEGHPLPHIVWLSASGLLEDQDETWEYGPYQRISCIPYLEEEQVFTCRAENSWGHAERSFPEKTDHLMLILTICGVVVVMLSAGILVYCLKRNRGRWDSDSPADGGQELQPVYSDVSCSFYTVYTYVKTPQ
ncbi:sialic acid-binding Ig-like lectin 15 isoform X2 [Melanotaenia boesemani]|uniref:sialic acid-binding Ig-like lectin 15 isoform X2 n=1 Tax=Melanotaenia boesemani TaxID=1250792 RepID=UPI001C044DCC|nr:sialic acid-binding Ig-like lectin 15 isoform X2 [Melanotaenia boesemani]